MSANYRILALVTSLVLVLDQATKLYIVRTMELHDSITVVGGLFDITYLRNRGAAFSFLADSPFRLPFLILVSLIAVAAICVYFRKLRPDQRFTAFSLSLVLSGALGNLIDRVRQGEVVDFLSLHWRHFYWPAFNVADSAICVGVFLLAIDMFLEEKRQKGQKP